MLSLKVKVTKDILYRARNCEKGMSTIQGCAIAIAIREVLPTAAVYPRYILTDFYNIDSQTIKLPEDVAYFIDVFDTATPTERVEMNEFEFIIHIQPEVFENVSMEELYEVLLNSKTLELV